MSSTAWRIVWSDPLMAVRSAITLLARLWNVVPLGEQVASIPRGVMWGMGLFYSALLLFMLMGLITAINDWATWAPLALLVISVTSVHLLYWADMRMRAPLVPAIALIAVAGMGRLPFAGIFGGTHRPAAKSPTGQPRTTGGGESPIPPV